MSEPAPAERAVYATGCLKRMPKGRIRIDLTVNFRRAPLPPTRFWQISRDLACVEGEVVLDTAGAAIVKRPDGRSIEVEQETVHKTAHVGGGGAKTDFKLPGVGLSLHADGKQEAGLDHKLAWVGSHDLVTVSLLDADKIRWNCHLPPAGQSYIERTEELYAVAQSAEEGVSTESESFRVRARVRRFEIIDGNGRAIPRMLMWAFVAKLLRRREFDPRLLTFELDVPAPGIRS